MKLLLLFCICTVLFSFYLNLQTGKLIPHCLSAEVETVPEIKPVETSYSAGSANPFIISAIIPHWE